MLVLRTARTRAVQLLSCGESAHSSGIRASGTIIYLESGGLAVDSYIVVLQEQFPPCYRVYTLQTCAAQQPINCCKTVDELTVLRCEGVRGPYMESSQQTYWAVRL